MLEYLLPDDKKFRQTIRCGIARTSYLHDPVFEHYSCGLDDGQRTMFYRGFRHFETIHLPNPCLGIRTEQYKLLLLQTDGTEQQFLISHNPVSLELQEVGEVTDIGRYWKPASCLSGQIGKRQVSSS